jgi:hypothetical protein
VSWVGGWVRSKPLSVVWSQKLDLEPTIALRLVGGGERAMVGFCWWLQLEIAVFVAGMFLREIQSVEQFCVVLSP